jgi:endogenous inhibitor of DNA gyrase (YacG/DUF329 family)
MHDLKEKAAYLRGLVEGTNFTQDEKQKVIWDNLTEFCDEIAENMEELEDSQDEFAEYIEAIDEDLSTLEKFFYDSDENNEETELLFSPEAEKSVMELSCPFCREEIYFDDEPGNYEVVCPECGKVVWNHIESEEPLTAEKADVI